MKTGAVFAGCLTGKCDMGSEQFLKMGGRVRDSKLKLVKENVSSQVVPLTARKKTLGASNSKEKMLTLADMGQLRIQGNQQTRKPSHTSDMILGQERALSAGQEVRRAVGQHGGAACLAEHSDEDLS